MNTLRFKEWLTNLDAEKTHASLSDLEVANIYFHNPGIKVREIAEKANKSIAEVYRILHRFGTPNRQLPNHENVISFASAGFPIKKIAEFTGYTPRNIRYILKKSEN